ncbi:hypothetical protein FALCPG4_010572 [Fusarium falciforme]
MGDMHNCNLGSCGLHAANDTIASLPRLFTDLVFDPIDSSQIPDKVLEISWTSDRSPSLVQPRRPELHPAFARHWAPRAKILSRTAKKENAPGGTKFIKNEISRWLHYSAVGWTGHGS